MTLLSAAVMLYSGRFIDAWPLRRFTLFVLGGLALGCLIMASAQHMIALAAALFLLRHFGQGLSSHTGMTTAGRSFEANRGQAFRLCSWAMPVLKGSSAHGGGADGLYWLANKLVVFAAALVLLAVPLQLYLSAAEPKNIRR